MKFYETLPAMTARAAELRRITEQADISGHNKRVLNMLAVPGYMGESFMKRRAMLVRELLRDLPLIIRPGELVIGSMLGVLPHQITDTYEERRVYADMSLAFPARNTVFGTQDYCYENRPLDDSELREEARSRWSWGHSCYGLHNILKKGYLGMAQEAREQIEHGSASPAQKDFWESVIMACEAVAEFAARYADELARLTQEENDPVRRQELIAAEKCVRHAPAHPARSFYEAVQATWLSFMVHFIFNGTDIGRLDQLLYPYYAADCAAGVLDREKAQELMDCLWIKLFEIRVMIPDNRGLHPSIMLAGLNADGRDGTNDVTYLCLNATRHVCSPNPKLSLRINEQTPDALYEMAHAMLAAGYMMPDFYNERAIIDAYGKIGVPFEDAVCFAQSVCEEVSLAGISEECTNEGPHIDLHDLVMRAMRRSAEDDAPFDTLMARVEEEICIKVASEVDFHRRQTEKLARFLPQPLHSATIDGCIASGVDILSGGAKYNNTGSVLSGIATAANSLYSIRRLVYEEKRLTLAEFLDILDADYVGHEALRAEILSKFPKYGNDEDAVDQYACAMFEVFARELGKYRNSRGGVFKLGAWASEFRSNYPATPDGRKRWDSFAVNVSPTPGTDVKGATAVIRSGTKLGLNRCTAGGMLDVTISPSAIRGEQGVQVLKYLLQAYCAMGGAAIQFNFVDTEMLEKAQAEPLKYKNLMVRVWGYNDYFVALRSDLQKHIIDRTRREQG